MANLNTAIVNNVMDNLLPMFGTTPVQETPIWDEGQKMFIFDQYESAAGHRYYSGVRLSENLMIVERVGLYHNWTYIDGIELYSYNGRKAELIQKRKYDKVHRSEEFVRSESVQMLKDYFKGTLKMQKMSVSEQAIDERVEQVIDGSYKSFLEKDYNLNLVGVLPQLEQPHQALEQY